MQGEFFKGENQSRNEYPITSLKFSNGLPKSQGFSPGFVCKIAKSRRTRSGPSMSDVFCGGENTPNGEENDTIGKFGAAWASVPPPLNFIEGGINIARVHTFVRLSRLSMVDEFMHASWIELPKIPNDKSPNKVPLEKN